MSEKVMQVVKLSIKLTDTLDQSLIWELSKVEAEIDEYYIETLNKIAECTDCDSIDQTYPGTVRERRLARS